MYLIPFAAVALASCSNESTDSQQSRVAQSNTAALNIVPVVQGTTRGAIITDASINSFKVVATGDNDFLSVTAGQTPDLSNPSSYTTVGSNFTATITKDGNNKWPIETGKDYYWKSKSMTANFKAWWPDNVDFNTPGTTYTVKNNLTDQEDVICAYNEGAASDFTAGVPLNFQHALSQIVIKALNKDAGKVKIDVAGVKLNNLVNAGTLKLPSTPTTSGVFTWPEDTWSLSSSINTYKDGGATAKKEDLTNIVTLTSAAKQLTSEPFILMPQTTAKADLTQPSVTGAYFSVLVQVTDLTQSPNKQIYPTTNTTSNDDKYFAYVAIPVDIEWKPGYKYTYTLNFSEKGIGKVDPENSTITDNPGDGYPSAIPTGEDILDSPVQLFFTVTVENWTDAATSPLDM